MKNNRGKDKYLPYYAEITNIKQREPDGDLDV